MERQFIKRDTKNQKLIAGGALSPIVLDYIMGSEVPKPCRHFIGIEKDDMPKYLLFLENAFPYMDNYNYHKGMNGIIQELKGLLKTKNIGTDSDRALLLDFQATLETKPEKAIKLEKDALAQIENITADNARLVSNLHANLGGLYRMNGHPDLAREHMEKSISLLDQFNLLHINDSIPQIANYAMFLTEQQEPERGISELQKLSGIIKEYHSDHCLDYAKVQETLGTIYLMTANLSHAKTHFKKAFKIYEKIWADVNWTPCQGHSKFFRSIG